MAFGLTPAGFVPKTEAEILQSLLDGVQAGVAVSLDRGPESTLSRLLGAYARVLAEGWSAADAIWRAGTPAGAEGVLLDDLVAVTGIARLPATRSLARVLCIGRDGAELPAGRVVHSQRGHRFVSGEAAVLTPSLFQARVSFARPTPHTRYRLRIDGQAAEIIAGVGDTALALAQRLYAQLRTLNLPMTMSVERGGAVALLAHDLSARPAVTLEVEPPWTGELRLLAATAGQTYAVGVTEPSGNILAIGVTTGTNPPNAATILANIAGTLSAPSTAFDAELSGDGLALLIRHRFPGGLFALQHTAQLANRTVTPSAESLASLHTQLLPAALLRFDAESTGPIPAAALALDGIATPVAGWERAFNPEAAAEGRLLESDAELRVRQRRSLQVPGVAVRESVSARLRQEFPESHAVRVIENDADSADADGRPPHSFEVLIDIAEDPALDLRIARAIEAARPAGVRAVHAAGALSGSAYRQPSRATVALVDFQGQRRDVCFTRPGIEKICLLIQLHRHPDQSMPADVAEQVRALVVAWGRGLGVGHDVVLGRLLRAIHGVPGIGRAAFAHAASGWSASAPLPQDNPPNWAPIPGVGWMTPIPIGSAYRAVIDPQNVVVQVFV